MIYFPPNLTPVPKFPGYFWDVKDNVLYSIKVDGILKPLKVRTLHPSAKKYLTSYSYLVIGEPYYIISYKGERKYLSVKKLKQLHHIDYMIPKGEINA